jgi:signal transduction histidine kinase
MERRGVMVLGPAQRAALMALALAPVVAYVEVALLAASGVSLDARTILVDVLGPIVIAVLATSIVFALVIGGQALRLREAMRKLARGELGAGAVDARLDLTRDVLGIRETFESMRRELDRALRRMAHADAQRRRLFADLAHELATPASALLGLGDTLANRALAADDDRRARLLASLEGETLRIARLVEDIRDLAELDDPDVSFVREPVDVARVVAAAALRFAHAPGAAIDVEGDEVIVVGDAQRLDQALANLLKNARRYTPAARRIRVVVRRDGDSAIVVVEDEGPGVPPEALARLGERLFRVDEGRDRTRGGHGLGLSIVRAIVERHTGSVDFGVAPSGGLRVTLTMPAHDLSA